MIVRPTVASWLVLVGNAPIDDAAVDIVDEWVSNENIRGPGRHTPLGLTSPVS